jgi:hypothetical protein
MGSLPPWRLILPERKCSSKNRLKTSSLGSVRRLSTVPSQSSFRKVRRGNRIHDSIYVDCVMVTIFVVQDNHLSSFNSGCKNG